MNDPRIDDLLSVWNLARAEGRDPLPTELCRETPELVAELAERITVLRRMERLVSPASQHDTAPTVDGATPLAGPGSTHSPGRGDGAVLPHIPGYAISGEIARGGMGRVLAGREIALNREVAIKVLLPGADAERFITESQITAQLPHPNIAPVYALGNLADGSPYLAMKLIRGRTLAAELKTANRAADLPRFVQVFEQIAQAVGFAHSEGVIHRDLKPANVMLGAFGEVQVMDWGLAKDMRNNAASPGESCAQGASGHVSGTALAAGGHTQKSPPATANSEITQAGSVLGTPAYMAPEQARGERLDARADVFALGAILCDVLTGRPPFFGVGPWETVLQAAAGEVSAAFARLDECPADREMVALCKRCLSPAAEARPTDGQAVAHEVAAYRTGVEERLRRAEQERAAAAIRETEQRKRRRVQLALAATVALLVAGSGAFAWWQNDQTNKRKLAAAQQHATEVRLEVEQEFKAQQARQGVATNLHLAQDLRKQYKFKPAAAALAQAADLAEGAPELLPQVEEAQTDLAFVIELDDIRFRKWIFIAVGGGKGRFNTKIAAPEYKKAFAERGLDLVTLEPAEAARRVVASSIKAELVAAVDDWSLYEPDAEVRDRLLEVARGADQGPWTDQLRDPAVWQDLRAIERIAAEVEPENVAPAALTMLAELMRRNRLDPSAMLTAARVKHPTDFELAFALGQWHTKMKDGKELGPYEAARSLRPENATVWNNLANALQNQDDLAAAIAAYKRAIELDPKSGAGYSNLGAALRAQKNLNGAIAACRTAIEVDPKSASAYSNLGIALLENKEANGAIDAFRKAIELNPTHASAYSNLGVALRDQKDLNEAIAAHKKAIELDPKDASAYSNLGTVLFRRKELNGSINAFKKAIELNPKFTNAYINLGVALYEQKNLNGAIAAYKKAIELDPKCRAAYSNLGIVLRDEKDLRGAIAACKKAVELDPSDASAYKTLGSALREQKDLDGAIAAFHKVIELDPKLPIAYNSLGVALQDKKDLDGAVAAFRKAIELEPTSAGSYQQLGIALREQKDIYGAIAAYKKAIELDPKYVSAYFNLGAGLATTKDLGAAIAAYKKGIELDSNSVSAHTNLGVVYLQRGEYFDAVASARAAIKVDSNYASAHTLLGLALIEIGDVTGAREPIAEAIRLDPKKWEPAIGNLNRNAQMAIGDMEVVFQQDTAQVSGLVTARLRAFLYQKRHADAVATAERFAEWAEKQEPNREGQRYNAACLYARCAAAIEADRESLLDKALALLMKTKAAGYFTPPRIAHLKQDPDFHGIRTQPKFMQFMADLEQPEPPKSED